VKSSNYPFVTIIMPVRNEASAIVSSLGAIISQDYPAERMEIIIADGQSTDGTRDVVDGIKNKHSNLYLLENPGKIVPTGLNIALRRARGEIIIRVDGHTEIAPDYVRQCIEALRQSGADNVGGKMTANGIGNFGKSVVLATSSPFGVGDARFHFSDKEEFVDTVYLGAWPLRIFNQIGLFDEELVRNQDDEFNYRLRERGGKILLTPMIKSVYTVRGTPRALWRQYYQYGLWKVRVMQKHPKQMRLRQFVPPLFVASLLVSAGIVSFSRWGLFILAFIVSTYLFANLFASVGIARRHGWRHLPLLPLTFSILHMSYGLGFLVGLIRFVHKWGDKIGKTPSFLTAGSKYPTS
jgi:succinoglycan biosynthesis protein ExoA